MNIKLFSLLLAFFMISAAYGFYQSGFTYQQQVMSSPLFFPVIVSDCISMGLRSNRFFSHHIGARETLQKMYNGRDCLLIYSILELIVSHINQSTNSCPEYLRCNISIPVFRLNSVWRWQAMPAIPPGKIRAFSSLLQKDGKNDR